MFPIGLTRATGCRYSRGATHSSQGGNFAFHGGPLEISANGTFTLIFEFQCVSKCKNQNIILRLIGLENIKFCSSNVIRRVCVRSEHPEIAFERRSDIHG